MTNLSVVRGTGTKASKQAEPLSVAKLRAILEDEGMRRRQSKETFEAFEERLHGQLQAVERELLAEDLGRADVDAEGILVEGTAYRRVLRAEETYMTAAGPVRVERALYKDRTDEGERALVPMELKAGIVGGFWTPMAARQAAWVVSQMSPQMTEELFAPELPARMEELFPPRRYAPRFPQPRCMDSSPTANGPPQTVEAGSDSLP